jgi:hypothetical protein
MQRQRDQQDGVEDDELARLGLAAHDGIIGTPTRAYSSFMSSESAQKCGGRPVEDDREQVERGDSTEPVTAAQPDQRRDRARPRRR